MRHIAVLVGTAVALASVGLGVVSWVRELHAPDDGAPIGAGLIYLALVAAVLAVTTYLLHAGAGGRGAGIALTLLNIAIGVASQYAFFAWKDGSSQAGGLAGMATVCVLAGAAAGTAAGLARRS